MADADGMLMNFSVGEGPLDVNQTFKGGRWKDRLSAKKFARDRALRKSSTPSKPATEGDVEDKDTPATKDATDSTEAGEEASSRPNKRRRVASDSAPSHYPRPHPTSTQGPSNSAQGRVKERPHQVISSLFSYNPDSTTPATKADPSANDEPIKPSNAPMSDEIATFVSELKLSPTISAHLLSKLGLKAPTEIQKSAIPQLITEDADAFIQAQTGSGKTLAYLLPIVQRIMAMSTAETSSPALKGTDGVTSGHGGIHRSSGLFAIILVPTRELSRQILEVLKNVVGCAHWIVPGTVIGGESKKSEKARLRKGLNILVATPGRLADHLDNTEALDVSNVRWLVLDEGDRLMELGFEEEIKKIVTKLGARSKLTLGPNTAPALPKRRVTVLCSATMKMSVQRLGEISLKDAVHLKADSTAEDKKPDPATSHEVLDLFSAPAQLKQAYAVIPTKLRLVTLSAILRRAFARRGSVMKMIIFMSCYDSVDFHFQVFTRPPESESKEQSGPQKAEDPKTPDLKLDTVAPLTVLPESDNQVNMYKLHGSLPQKTRTSTLAAFSKATEPAVLVCTDVASRGLDLPNIDFVVEYDPPYSKGDHLHRVGRTARAGRDGRALIFLLPGEEEGYVSVLKEVYRDGGKGLTRNEPNEILKKGFIPNGKVTGHNWEERATEWQLDVERWVLENPRILQMAKDACRSHIGAYATHVAPERHIFNLQALHLGHLAKSFGLRDPPSKLNVPGLRKTKDGGKAGGSKRTPTKAGGSTAGEERTMDHGDARPAEANDAAKKMRRKMQEHMAGISEFNIG